MKSLFKCSQVHRQNNLARTIITGILFCASITANPLMAQITTGNEDNDEGLVLPAN